MPLTVLRPRSLTPAEIGLFELTHMAFDRLVVERSAALLAAGYTPVAERWWAFDDMLMQGFRLRRDGDDVSYSRFYFRRAEVAFESPHAADVSVAVSEVQHEMLFQLLDGWIDKALASGERARAWRAAEPHLAGTKENLPWES